MTGESLNNHGSAEEAWGNSPLEIEDNLRLAFEDAANNIPDPEQRRDAVNELFTAAHLADVPSSTITQVYELVRTSSPELAALLGPIETEETEGQVAQIRPDSHSNPDFDEPSDRLRNVS